MFFKNKIIIYKYSGLIGMPEEIKKYWVEFASIEIGPFDSIFIIDKNEILVKIDDYLILKGKKLYYFPREIWESKNNKDFIRES